MSEPIYLIDVDIDVIVDALAEHAKAHIKTAMAYSPTRDRVDWAVSQQAYANARRCDYIAERLGSLRGSDGHVVRVEKVTS
ncbi:hypothetical protein [Propionibacterium australiense]|uniref:Uncharacterized protein n=1 Tax=Propionibacterium australiense TaxID=119981 RepID=A0A8B3FS56_9ACTN|nr:hypothetical protein [Propionibacterium australiense]RLP12236.1 hypothetical protein D7U36_02970 [Propionibacterium australiense]